MQIPYNLNPALSYSLKLGYLRSLLLFLGEKGGSNLGGGGNQLGSDGLESRWSQGAPLFSDSDSFVKFDMFRVHVAPCNRMKIQTVA